MKHFPGLLLRRLLVHVVVCWPAWSGVAIRAEEMASAAPASANLLLITIDGLRWQEVFAGADELLLSKEAGGVKDPAALRERFWRSTPEARREALLPFFWSTLATQGVLLGNPNGGPRAVVTNGLNFSYPGYSEILCGYVDFAITSNAKKNNTNVTVLEWLHNKPGFRGKIAAFCSWDVFPFIINEQRSGIPVNAGWEPLAAERPRDRHGPDDVSLSRLVQLDRLSQEIPRYWPEVRYDYFTFCGARESLEQERPRVLYVALGETDDWAHAGRYDLYLDAAARNDRYLANLWETVQSLPEYKDNTTLIVTTDHGRGDNRVDWKSHGKDVDDCQFIWVAVLGPNVTTSALCPAEVTQSQIAATIAACLGYDYGAAQPRAAPPLPVLRVMPMSPAGH